MALNGTIINYLNLAGNTFSSLENILSTNLNESFSINNQTSSFLYSIASTISTLSFSNCTNLLEINWFNITKLERLYNLDLSRIPKTNEFWNYRKTDDD